MNQITSQGPHPTVGLNGRANLEINLDGWPGTVAVGLIGATLIAITALFLKFRR